MFVTEKDLVNVLKENLGPLCSWNFCKVTTAILEEVNLGYGVADLVITKVPETCRVQQKLTYFDIVVYKIIESNSTISFDKIRSITKANTTSIKKSLTKLILESYVNESDCLLSVNHPYELLIEDTIAIEAKLKNWKRALHQAFRYKWFSSQSYVVLDSKYINPALSSLEEFKKLNVGLAEINNLGQVIIHNKAIVNKPIDDKMTMLLNEQIKAYLVSK